MNEFFLAYLITLIFSLNEAANVCFLVAFFVAAAAGFVACVAYADDEKTRANVILRKAAIAMAICMPIAVITPSAKQGAYIAAIGLGLKSMKNEQMQQLPDNIARLLNKYIEDALKEEKPK